MTRVSQLLATTGWVVPVVVAISSLSWLLAGWWFRKTRPVADWEPAWPHRIETTIAVWIGIGVGFAVMFAAAAAGAITAAVFGLERIEAAETLALAGARGPVLAAIFVGAVIVAPIGEELFFRGHLFRWTASRCGLRYAYVLTAAIFAVGHLNPPGIPGYAVAAVIFGWSYDRWRTLVVPIVAHMTMNGVGLSLFVLVSRVRPDLVAAG